MSKNWYSNSVEKQRCSAPKQLCFSADFQLWKFSFSMLFRAESTLFRDFQVMNSAESEPKHLWNRND